MIVEVRVEKSEEDSVCLVVDEATGCCEDVLTPRRCIRGPSEEAVRCSAVEVVKSVTAVAVLTSVRSLLCGAAGLSAGSASLVLLFG